MSNINWRKHRAQMCREMDMMRGRKAWPLFMYPMVWDARAFICRITSHKWGFRAHDPEDGPRHERTMHCARCSAMKTWEEEPEQ